MTNLSHTQLNQRTQLSKAALEYFSRGHSMNDVLTFGREDNLTRYPSLTLDTVKHIIIETYAFFCEIIAEDI
jgi:hypothetical protein